MSSEYLARVTTEQLFLERAGIWPIKLCAEQMLKVQLLLEKKEPLWKEEILFGAI